MASFGNEGMSDTTGSSSSSSSSTGPAIPGMNNTRTGLPPQIQEQLTSQEVEALAKVKHTMLMGRGFGHIAGAAGTLYYLRRKGRPVFALRSLALVAVGSYTASWLTLAFAMFKSTGELRKVDDPKHLSDVLASAREEKMSRRPSGGPPPRLPPQSQPQSAPAGGPNGASSMPGPSPPPPRRTPAPPRSGAKTNQWGDEVGSTEAPYSNDYANMASVDQYTRPVEASAGLSPSGQGSDNNEYGSGDSNTSRWAQLRAQRGVQESSWERIRQQNAKEAYNRRAANGQGTPDQPAYSTSSFSTSRPNNDAELADPTFGKGLSSSRAQAQREYERSFDRERRGVDG